MPPPTPGTALIGTAAWSKRHWRGHFYPPGLPESAWLGYAAARLTTMEINATFRGNRTPATFRTWRDGVPADFVFSVKGPRTVTHDLGLEGAEHELAAFIASGVLELGEKLGAVLWQLPSRLPFRADALAAFLGLLPRSYADARALLRRNGWDAAAVPEGLELPVRHALEVRHPSFRVRGFLRLLRGHGVAAVATDNPGAEWIDEPTADFAYARLHSDPGHLPDGYDEATLDQWAARIGGWLHGDAATGAAERGVLAYLTNPGAHSTRPPFDALALQQRVGRPGRPPEATLQTTLW